ncbi:MAG: YidC/Oxa1 family membrane protein insertase [Thermoflexales bacterium]|nr:YidC/Oxa1 family membrane protein insertase [Thermoflexales bacterium]
MGFDIFDFLVNNPLTNALLALYGLFGNNFVLAIVVLTIVIKLSTLPLSYRQQVSSMKMAALQPKMKELQEKYKNDPQKLMEEQRKLGFSPLSGCLPMLIQFPILIGLYNAINRALAVTPLSLLDLGKHVYGFLPNISTLVPINSKFLFWDLGQPDHLYILPILPIGIIPVLVVLTTWLSNKAMTPPSTDPQSAQMNNTMQLMMPLMFGMFMISAPVGLGIYWLTSNLLGVAQYFLLKPRIAHAKTQLAAANAASTAGSGSVSRPVAKPSEPRPLPKSKGRGTPSIDLSKAKDKDKDKDKGRR